MKSKIIKFIAVQLLLIVLNVGCVKKNQLVNGIEVISEFPKEVVLTSNDTLPSTIDDMGMASITVVDSLMVINNGNTWSVYSLNGKYFGDALKTGDGPCELTRIPFTSDATLEKGDSIKFYLIDKLKGKEVEFNLSAYIRNDTANIPYLREKQLDFLSHRAWGPIKVSNDSYIFATPAEAETKQVRMIATGDSITDLNLPSAICQATINQGENINILSRINAYSLENSKVVEACVMQNVISVYTPDGKFDKSVSIGRPLLAEEIMSTDPENRKYTFRDIALWKNGFGVLSYPLQDNEEKDETGGKSEIYIFNWECDPLMKIVVDIPVQTFDIDFNNDRLFAVDADNDEMRVYKIDTAGIK